MDPNRGRLKLRAGSNPAPGIIMKLYLAGSMVMRTQRVLRELGARRLISFEYQSGGAIGRFWTTKDGHREPPTKHEGPRASRTRAERLKRA